ncbi:MAG: ComEC/Rec2 family competence protein, partial [Alphaproteobacteria bacterium]|nr:ComEC/Rec2 family competence protein [Alphaproteobacteria bacterium]
YARWTYFNNQTATGYAETIEIINDQEDKNINTFRDFLHNASESFLVDTLVLGYKGKVPGADDEIWTASGVGHIWSISGFHMTLVGGWMFAIFYLIFRSIPYITRRTPAKIPAMICAWVGLAFYLLLSGMDIATMRAFLMTSFIFAAFILGRNAISMRNVALAFCAIFLMNPHCVMQAGFQLSFAAVFGLVWLYSDIKPKMPTNKLLKIIYATVLTSLVASVFTAPFIAAHFGKIPTYSLIGNLVLLPIFSIIIMPLVLIGTITAPFGFHLPNTYAHNVYEFTLQIATKISDLPFAEISMPYISNTAMIFFISAFVCLITIRSEKLHVNYILFAGLLFSGVVIVHIEPKPLFYSSYDNELVAFVGDNGKLEFNKSRASNHYFAFDTWKQINNEETQTKNTRRKHIKGVYEYKTKNFNLVYIQKFVPLMNNITKLCNDKSVDYIVSYFDIDSEMCANKILGYGVMIYPSGKIKNTSTKRPWNYNLHQ